MTARGDRTAGKAAGAAYVFDLATGQRLHKLTASNAENEAAYGWSLDVDGSRAVLGAPGAGIYQTGAAYVVDLVTGQELVALTFSGLYQHYGNFVAIDGDLVAVSTFSPSSKVRVYDLAQGAWLYELGIPERVEDVVLDGGRLFVNAGSDDLDVYVYDAPTGASLSVVEPPPGYFGWGPTVAVDGARLVGQCWDLVSHQFVVVVVDWTTGEQLYRLTEHDDHVDGFGAFVAIEGNRILASAHRHGDFHSGAAYVFEPQPLGLSYCGPAVSNSTGRPGIVRAFGSAAVGDDDVWLEAYQLPTSAFGYFLVGATQGFLHHPGGSMGDLCLAGSIGRHSGHAFDSGPGGRSSLILDLTSLPLPGGAHAIVDGETWNWTAWFRDQALGTSNFTNGVSITFQ